MDNRSPWTTHGHMDIGTTNPQVTPWTTLMDNMDIAHMDIGHTP